MQPRNRDVVDPQVALVPAAHLEDMVRLARLHYMYNAGGILFLVKRLKHQIGCWRSVIVDQVEILAIRFYHEGVGCLANLALKRLPEVRAVVLTLLYSLLVVKPLHRAGQMNEAHTTRTLAAVYQRIIRFGLTDPAESALGYVLSTRGGRCGLRIVI